LLFIVGDVNKEYLLKNQCKTKAKVGGFLPSFVHSFLPCSLLISKGWKNPKNKWKELLTMHLSNSVSDEVAIVYIATDLTEGSTQFEETEDLVIKKLPLRDAVEMVMNGEITDAISVAAIFKLKILIDQGKV
jgi:hypothetical protein